MSPEIKITILGAAIGALIGFIFQQIPWIRDFIIFCFSKRNRYFLLNKRSSLSCLYLLYFKIRLYYDNLDWEREKINSALNDLDECKEEDISFTKMENKNECLNFRLKSFINDIQHFLLFNRNILNISEWNRDEYLSYNKIYWVPNRFVKLLKQFNMMPLQYTTGCKDISNGQYTLMVNVRGTRREGVEGDSSILDGNVNENDRKMHFNKPLFENMREPQNVDANVVCTPYDKLTIVGSEKLKRGWMLFLNTHINNNYEKCCVVKCVVKEEDYDLIMKGYVKNIDK